jgi:hypothetical protein
VGTAQGFQNRQQKGQELGRGGRSISFDSSTLRFKRPEGPGEFQPQIKETLEVLG